MTLTRPSAAPVPGPNLSEQYFRHVSTRGTVKKCSHNYMCANTSRNVLYSGLADIMLNYVEL